MRRKSMDAGVKKNTAGEQVHGSYSMFEGVGLRNGSWVAGCIENFNLVKVEVAENNIFSSTCWRFLLRCEER